MSQFNLSVVITTYNRPELVQRAVASVAQQRRDDFNIEIIVVDDASPCPLPQFMETDIVTYQMPVNGGPGPARMQGLSLAHAMWVLMLDDDDTLEPDAVSHLMPHLTDPVLQQYPVMQFARTNGKLCGDDRVIHFDDYLSGQITGDFAPIFNRAVFLHTQLGYPNNRAGGEHILWWRLAMDYGIPTFSKILVTLYDDAQERLTHFSSQVKKAADHQQLAEITLTEFGVQLQTAYPTEYQRVCLARITYSMLNNQCRSARSYLTTAPLGGKMKSALWLITWLPQPLIKKLFLFYRQRQG
ncbi:glycosyltransferase family 2 protein [Serratia rhizosphaerae]|uniref:glycosyltransferase family 2 protein n=1 Tax=Serratia rhizosphaerae TaxID=2597702 RepID=UPI0013573D95|nr:glycosyltransferase family 2 protein [Serratia rhizosphaerae]